MIIIIIINLLLLFIFVILLLKCWQRKFASTSVNILFYVKIRRQIIRKLLFLIVFTKSLCHVIEVMCGPLMQTLENRLERNERKTEELLREKEELERRLEAIRNA